MLSQIKKIIGVCEKYRCSYKINRPSYAGIYMEILIPDGTDMHDAINVMTGALKKNFKDCKLESQISRYGVTILVNSVEMD